MAVLLDNDLSGMLDLLDNALQRSGWGELQLLQFVSLHQVGLADNAIDREVWRTAQTSGMILLTANRNLKDPDSLEQTIREENTPFSLPVITISDPQELINPDYRDRCLNRLVEIVFDLENYLGSARLFIP
ncbi:MAG: ACP S-malonyltransferase [Acidobacteria bacterium]|nr:ACP S-malonyltransferase [Acidobacteriota bacterium]